MKNSLQEVLANKKSQLDAETPNRDKLRDDWIEKVNNLYSLINNWLSPLEENGYLRLIYSDIYISEEILGRYKMSRIDIIFFNNEKVELIPIGLHVIGAKGKVNMEIGDREIMIVGNADDTGWIFAEREGRGKPRTWIFDEDNFNEILKEYAEGF